VLPQGLEETYDGVLRRIMLSNPDRIEELKCIFRWLIGGEYILDLRELAEAVSIGPEDKELDLDGIATDPEDLAAFGSSLVTVDRRHDPPLISFAHYSIEEYLRSPRILKSPMAEFHMDRFSVNRALAISCLQYLSFANFATPLSPRFDYQDNFAEALSSRLKQHSLLFYAANNWYKHLRASGTASESFDAEVQVHMQWFLHPNVNGNQYTSWQEVVDPRFSSFRHRRAFILDLSFHPPLYVALACGLDNVANLILSQMSEQEIAVMLSDGLTPLHAAAMQGHPDMLETLLKAGIPIDAPSKGKNARKLTALHIAAEASNVAAVRFLLMAGASPHARSAAGTTPFYKAVRAGCETVIDDLYNAGSDCDVRTWNYWTPMIEAISENNVSVVEKLLSWGVDPLARHNPAIMSPMELAQFLKRGAIVEVMEAAIKKEKHVSVEEKGPNAVRKPHSHLSGTKSVESGMGVNFRQRGSAQDAPPILVVETYIPSPLETYMPSPVPFGDPKNSLADWSPRSLSAHQSLPTRSYSPGRLQQQNQDK
jgi:ankyrin repeat protein